MITGNLTEHRRSHAIVFLDGQYVSLLAKHFGSGKPIPIDLREFAHVLGENVDVTVLETFYYTAPPYQSPRPTEEEKARKGKYDAFVRRLRTIQEFTVREGRCQKRQNGTYQQKGVDTLLTMDLATEPFIKNVSDVIIVTADTDFVPIIESLVKRGVRVTLYSYTDKVRGSAFSTSNHLIVVCTKWMPITRSHYEKARRI